MAGNGKEQLLAFQLSLEQDQQLAGVYFLVDRDYDENPPLSHVYVLDAYSIENLLCTLRAVESLLSDELRCAGDPDTREDLLTRFNGFLDSFALATHGVHEVLFCARREGIRVELRPEHAREFTSVTLSGVAATYSDVSDVVRLATSADPERTAQRKAEFAALHPRYALKGKYLMQALRMWVRLLADDRRSARPTLFPDSLPKLPGSPEQFSLRRLASLSPIPEGLSDFASAITRNLPQMNARAPDCAA